MGITPSFHYIISNPLRCAQLVFYPRLRAVDNAIHAQFLLFPKPK